MSEFVEGVTEAGTFRGLAAKDKSGAVQAWEYHPRVLGKQDVEIEVECCGVCASDVDLLKSRHMPCSYPQVGGHEVVGKVVQVGDGVDKSRIGQRVGVGPYAYSCFECGMCKSGNDNYCPSKKLTIMGVYPDGQQCQGGWADKIRVDGRWAVPIPDEIPSTEAAPLMCAGLTVFSPLKFHKVEKGTRVGVIAIGGLGHLAVQFAKARGAEVYAISHSDSKKELATKLGAHHFVNSSDAAQMKANMGKLDLILCTASYSGMQLQGYCSLLGLGGKMVMIGWPDTPINVPITVIFARHCVTGSAAGSRADAEEMLKFAVEHDIHPMVEVTPMSKANEAIQRLVEGKPRFRIVLQRDEF